jgi:hypothetical protein
VPRNSSLTVCEVSKRLTAASSDNSVHAEGILQALFYLERAAITVVGNVSKTTYRSTANCCSLEVKGSFVPLAFVN